MVAEEEGGGGEEEDEVALAVLEETRVVFTRFAARVEEDTEEEEVEIPACLFMRLRKSTSPTAPDGASEDESEESAPPPFRFTWKRTQLITNAEVATRLGIFEDPREREF